MKKSLRKAVAAVLAAIMVMAVSVPAMADEKPKVYVNFICDGITSGKYVPVGSNVTAPSVPLHDGFTFCGFDKSLYNVTANTTYVAVYVNNQLGEEAIKQKKASLPTPAVSPTTVADPNAAPAVTAAIPSVLAALPTAGQNASSLLAILQAQQAAVNTASANAAANVAATAVQAAKNAAQTPAGQAAIQAAQAAAQNAAQTVQAAAQAPADQNAQTAALALQAVAQAAQAAAQTPAGQAAVQAVQAAAQTPAAQEAAQAAQAAAQTPAVQAAAQAAAPAVTAAATGLPGWAVSLHGVDAAGCAEVYKYWKTVKNADDATIQGNWDALLYHYSGHGTQGW